MIRVIDTTSEFLNFYFKNYKKNYEYKIWENFYNKNYNKFFIKIKEEAENEKINIEESFKEIVNTINENRNSFIEISNNLQCAKEEIDFKIRDLINEEISFEIFIYIGFCAYAGWATFLEKSFVIFFDVTKINKLKWDKKDEIRGLLSHEIAHIIHMKFRDDIENFEKSDDSYFLLYSEGFAQWFGEKLSQKDIWYAFKKEDLNWCIKNLPFLKNEYLKRIEKGLNTLDFFGDSFDIQGKRMIGYYLGYDFISYLEKFFDLNSIIKLKGDDIKNYLINYLKEEA